MTTEKQTAEQKKNAKAQLKDLTLAAARDLGLNTDVPINEAVMNTALKSDLRVAPIQNDSYIVKQSNLWLNLFWRIAEDIVSRVVYKSKFAIFNGEMPLGGDLAEEFIRLKTPQDREQLPNTDILTDYVDKVDMAVHRVNHVERFATTFSDAQARKTFQTWDSLSTFIADIIDNLQQSYNVNTDRQIMQEFVDGYAAGMINAETISSTPANVAVQINTKWDEFTLEPSGDFVGWNLNSAAAGDPLENISQNAPYLIIEAKMMRNIEFLDALSLYFTRINGNNNDLFSRVIKVKEFPQPSTTIPTGKGYTPVAAPKQIRAMLIDENFLKYKTQFLITTDFFNAATLKTNAYLHYDNLISFSPFENALVFTD